MNEILQNISSAKHIEIEVEEGFIALGSALYSYVLTKHKKVSFVCKTKELSLKYSCFPWFEKIRKTNYSSADLSLKVDSSCLELFNTLKLLNIKINPKMATALYGGLILETENFVNSKTNGMFFATASELIESGADYKLCTNYLVKRVTLSELRLKALMLQKMTLKMDATVAEFKVSEIDFKSSGTSVNDAIKIMKESLGLEYVEKAVLLDEENKIIKTIEKEI